MALRFLTVLLFLSPGAFAQTLPPLTEHFVLQRVVESDRLGKIAQIRARIEENEVDRVRAAFDYHLLFEAGHRIDASDRVTTVFGTRNDTTTLRARVRTLLPTGTAVEAGFLTIRSTSDSPFSTINPAHDSALIFGIRQPVLRNGFGSTLRADIAASEARAASARASSRADVEAIAAGAGSLFWELVAAHEDVEVVRGGLEKARWFREVTRNKKRLGTAEDADEHAAEAQVASKNQEVAVAVERVGLAAIRLRHALLIDPDTEISPGQRRPEGEGLAPLDVFLAGAESRRGEIAAASLHVEALSLRLEAARRDSRPSLDLFSTLALNKADDGWHSSAGGAFASDNPDFSIGGELTIPIGNRLARASVRRLELERSAARLYEADLRDRVATEVRLAHKSLSAAGDLAARAEEIVRLERRKVSAKQNDFSRGRADAISVLVFHEDLIRAEARLVALRLRKAVAGIELRRAAGELLEPLQ